MRRSSSRFTSGRSRTPRTSVKIAALAPIPSASVRTTISVSPLALASERRAYLMSRAKTPTISPKLHPSAFVPVMSVLPFLRPLQKDVVPDRTLSTGPTKKLGFPPTPYARPTAAILIQIPHLGHRSESNTFACERAGFGAASAMHQENQNVLQPCVRLRARAQPSIGEIIWRNPLEWRVTDPQLPRTRVPETEPAIVVR